MTSTVSQSTHSKSLRVDTSSYTYTDLGVDKDGHYMYVAQCQKTGDKVPVLSKEPCDESRLRTSLSHYLTNTLSLKQGKNNK